jgi:hypothetical protein
MHQYVVKTLFFLFIVLASSCGSKQQEGGAKKKTLPQSRGEVGEIILVMDSIQWEGALGLAFKRKMLEEIKGLPQPEALFTIRRVSPLKLNDFLKMASNMIIVHTLDNTTREGNAIRKYFTDNSLKTIAENDRMFYFAQSEVYAKGQEVVYLFANTEQQLINHLNENGSLIKDHFDQIENKRTLAKLSKSPEKGLMNLIKSTTGNEMLVPLGYELAHQRSNFLWMRLLDKEREKNIWISWKPYESEEEFNPANLVGVRDSLAKRFIFDVEKPELHLASQNKEPFYHQFLNFNGHYGVELKGLWKYSDSSRGGAFVGYLFVDEETNRLYYIEGYLDAPGKTKREGMRELHVILNTFKTRPTT